MELTGPTAAAAPVIQHVSLDENAVEHGAANNQRHEPFAHPDADAEVCRVLDGMVGQTSFAR